MSTQRVPLEALQKVRQYIQAGLVLPESELSPRAWSEFYSNEGAQEPPEPHSLDQLADLFHFGGIPEATPQVPNTRGQWFISVTNPGTVFLKLPGLKLKENTRLVTYLYRMGNDGISTMWAMPEVRSTMTQLQAALSNAQGPKQPPKPHGALPDVMDAIVGDDSPMSFVIASLVRRELSDFGTTGRAVQWKHHRLINALPPQVEWDWQINPVTDLSPKVRVFEDGRVAIEFFTCRVGAAVALFQHVDQYTKGSYHAKCVDRTIAVPVRLPVRSN